jgi:outer membrane protein OmpA-like peptidoglycan-associated protein
MKILSIGVGFICAASLYGTAAASETYYDAGSKALPLQQSAGTARATAMGSSVVAVPQGSASLLWNPAGLSQMSCQEASIHHNSGLGDTIQETAIFGMPLGKVGDCSANCKGGSLGGIAASFGYVSYGKFDGRDILGADAGSYHAGDFSGSVGWGMELFSKFSGGIALKANQSTFDSKTYNAYTTDIGFMYALLKDLNLGLSYSNINLGSKIGGDQLASGMRLGAAWTLDKHLMLTAATELEHKAVNRLQIGTEYLIGNLEEKVNVVALRAGYQANYPNPQLDGLTGLTLGLGYTITKALALDYAMVPAGELGTSHRFSLTYKFDCPGKPKAAATPEPAPAPVVVAPKPKPVVVLKEIELTDEHFAFDSAELQPKGMEALNENVQLLKDNPTAVVQVEGYASIRGTEEYNQKLSERRAKAVADHLVSKGIAADRITTVGYGEMRPAMQQESSARSQINSTAAKANRRVIIRVMER